MDKRKFQIVKAVACAAAIIFLFGLNACIDIASEKEHSVLNTDQTTVSTTVVNSRPTEYLKVDLSEEEIELIALVTVAEAEGESVLGKRLVIDTILNRTDAVGFPNTVSDVIFQPNAFESIWNGRINNCTVNSAVKSLVSEESLSRTNEYVLYFNAEGFSDYGTPLFQEGNHYFSGS